ncbi:1,4-dihydroxy-6-naphtoate synthase [Campylobacterota bacterium]|nr:1,4-dihydroxy-6-naphtoate synthase [Campylobacterota bacterium]
MPNYTVAHSPDADDIFMYSAIAFGWIDTGDIKLANFAADIESLNESAEALKYDATAISFAFYPHIFGDQALLRTAASFGQGYGPKLICRKDKKLRKNFTVALSGARTTNALLFRAAYPEARAKYMNFLEIERAVLEGETDAGVLIHESILNYSDELRVEAEIWDIWRELAGADLPLPLGGMCLRRSLPLNRAIEMERILAKAVRAAVDHKALIAGMLIDRGLARVDLTLLDRYLSLYANEDSVDFSAAQKQAIETLFKIGYDRGEYREIVTLDRALIPIEYANLRGF